MGRLDDRPATQILDRIFDYKAKRISAAAIPGVDLSSMTVDSPIPFSLKKLWLSLLTPK
jgi:hypothetical protein